MKELDVCPQCRDKDETFTRHTDAPDGVRVLDAPAVDVCDGCGFVVRVYDDGFDY